MIQILPVIEHNDVSKTCFRVIERFNWYNINRTKNRTKHEVKQKGKVPNGKVQDRIANEKISA